MAGIVDRYTPVGSYPRLIVAFALSSVPLTLFCFGAVVVLNTYRPTEAMEGIPGLVLAGLLVTLLLGTQAANVLVRDVAERAPDGAGDSFRRLAGVTAGATVGLPAFIYGVFALTWPIQQWLYVGRVGSVAVLLFGVLAVALAHSTARGTSDRTAGSDFTADDEAESAETPLATLKRRYANGELTDEEFERKLNRLLELDESLGRGDSGTDGSLRELADERLLERE